MDDLDALLADLQNTTAHLNHSSKENGGGYGSVNSSSRNYSTTSEYTSPQHSSIKTERGYELSAVEHDSPVYQNQKYIREVNMSESVNETTSVTVTQHSPRSVNYQPVHHLPITSNNTTTLNNNLSELDTLLEDLNSARYADYPDKKVMISTMNGPTTHHASPLPPYHKNLSPSSSVSSGGIQEVRPSVESLLDELQSAVPPGSSPPSYSPTIKSMEQTRLLTYTTLVPEPVVISTPAPTASSATKELDDLMASLSDFKINSTQLQSSQQPQPSSPPPPAVVSDSPYAKPNKPRSPAPTNAAPANQLDSMLGTLQSDMSRQGVNTTQKGCCAACSKPIVGQVVTALAKTWHPEHFTCAHCNQELGTKNFFERNGKPYCENDYHNLFSPRCAYCNGPILDKCVTALDKTWHPEHFFCAQCGNQFGEDGFHEKDGKAYCKDDYFDMFAPKCGGCGRPIMENYISALNAQWHPDCFACKGCKASLSGGSFYVMEGKPMCSKCCGVGDDDEEEEEEEA